MMTVPYRVDAMGIICCIPSVQYGNKIAENPLNIMFSFVNYVLITFNSNRQCVNVGICSSHNYQSVIFAQSNNAQYMLINECPVVHFIFTHIM